MNAEKRVQPGHLLFYIAFSVYVTAGLLDYTVWAFTESGDLNAFGLVLKALRYFVYALCLVKMIFFTDFRLYHFLPVIIAAAVLILALLTSRDSSYVFPALIIISFIDIPFEKILKVSFYCSLLVLLITVLCSLLGVIEDYVRVESGRTRHFLGFSWATFASIILFFIILEYIAMNRGKLSIAETVVIFALSFWLYKMTDARFAFAMELLELAFFFVFGRLFDRERSYKPQLYRLLLAVPWLAAVFSFFLHYLYDPDSPLWYALNKLLSSRLYYGNLAISKYGVHLLGQKITWVGFSMRETLKAEYNFVDCSYLRELLRNGILFLLLILIIMSVIMNESIDKKDYHMVWIMVFISVFSITEMWLCASLAFDPFLACITIWGTKHMWKKDEYMLQRRIFRYSLKLRRS